VTLAACLAGCWAIGSFTRLWPTTAVRLGLGWPAVVGLAVAVGALARWRGTFGLSVGTALAPAAAAAALIARLDDEARRRTLEAAVVGGAVVVIGRALFGGAASPSAAAVAGIAIAAMAAGEASAAAGALLGAGLGPALARAAPGAAAGADDLALTATTAVVAASVLGQGRRAWARRFGGGAGDGCR
jgi:hypothetical protein